ncbi:nucleotide-diphospho-sugar transferase [Pyronema omphalodes]|nr:nucleotide-diphospho-sugar transferase [Pyronema omphalodes]
MEISLFLPPSQLNSDNEDDKKPGAWIVLLTQPSYLPGVILLGYSLRKVDSKYPLVAAVTPSLPDDCRQALIDCGIKIKEIAPLQPKDKVKVVAERFEDTWSKLAVFGFEGYQRAILIDADMLLLKNMDHLMNLPIPDDWIAANHACVCNLDRDSWAPEDWREENCAYTPMVHPDALENPTQVTPSSIRTHTLLNSGLVVFTPSKVVLNQMREFLATSQLVKDFSFPDQDFLAHFYKGRWMPIGWQYNAIKTARYWHPKMWNDDAVVNVHYICDKPWKVGKKRGTDDEVTHTWWWDHFDEWRNLMAGYKEGRSVNIVERYTSDEHQV